ncbi:MAG: hypothetical protein H6564_05410 [Lewinellaceae bacterium]|nr:hypothetical protein [Lewinellaceae bacterium]
MKPVLTYSALFLIFLLAACTPKTDGPWLIQAPAGERLTLIDKTGETVLPNGRLIRPYGEAVMVAPHPFGLVLSPDGDVAVTANSGTSPLSISIIRGLLSGKPQVQQVPESAQTDRGVLAAVFMGLAISPDKEVVYVAGGQENCIYRFRLSDGAKLDSISCGLKNDTVDFSHGYIGDMVLSRDGQRLYAVDQINFRMIVVDTRQHKLLANVPVGRYPFGITLSPDEKTAYVANVGMYEYSWIPSFDKQRPEATALDFPPFAYLSEESIKGIRTDSFNVPGLGSPNVPESFSVWAVNLEQNKVEARIKTGILVGEKIDDIPAVGGASPNSVVATDKYVFVSNGNNDCISVISTETDTVVHTIRLQVDERLGNLRGVIPFGLALSPDGRRLYIAEAGINAVAVADVSAFEVIGHIPAGWFPSKLKVSPDGKKLIVANAKGYGSGPNGGPSFTAGPEGSYIGGLMKGSVSVMDIPSDRELKALTRQVVANNFAFEPATAAVQRRPAGHPIPVYPGERKSPIRHIVFISKENRTYDEVYGQVKQGRGEASLARYGYRATFRNRDGSMGLDSVTVMPNHLALAERFAIADNFYVDADVSADGHRWLACTYPNEWVESSVASAYAGARDLRWDSKAPGNLAFEGASGAIYPEDYNEAGSLWDHLARHGIAFFNFGCGIMFAPHLSDNLAYPKGYGYAVNYPVTEALFQNSSKRFPTYNTSIPDQYRVDQFEQEFTEKWLSGQDSMPPMVTIIISNDHGAGERPGAGYPFRESYMADNDLALGRIVEFLSHTPYWKSMAIVVTEDDAQGGVDHIDAHRSLLMVLSPYAAKGTVATTHYSFGSIFKAFWHILGIPYLNQYDASATDLGAMFTSTPDFTPYRALKPDLRLFDPAKAPGPLNKDFDWQSLEEGPDMDDVEYIQENWE